MKREAPKSIFIDIREWRDRTYGNTYYSAIVTVDGEWQFTTGMTYGYGNQAVHDCWGRLAKMYGFPTDSPMAPTYQARQMGISLYTARRDVLKRELPKQADHESLTA